MGLALSRLYSIGIAGAGIGGLATAAFLARAGHRVRVFDQFDAPAPVGSGLVLQETGLTILRELGLRAEMEALGAPIERLYGLVQPSGRTVLDVRYTALRKGLSGLAVQRPALFDLVHRAALEAGAELVPSTRITAASASSATLVDETGRSHAGFDLIVDALGVRSPLSSKPKKELPYGALWATLPWPTDGSFADDALEQRYFSARQMAGVMPSGAASPDAPRMATYFWSIRADQYEAFRAEPLIHWRDGALRLWPETEALLSQIKDHDDLTFARYRHRTHWPVVEGKLVHLGDSWHAASPQLGQGANNALLDAYALMVALEVPNSGHKMGPGLARALEKYAKMRAGHVRLFQAMSYLFTPVYQSDSNILPWLRDWLAAPASRIWPAPIILAAMVSGAIGSPLGKLGLKPGR